MAQLPLVQLDWWKDPKGYRLAVIRDGGFTVQRVVRNGRPDGKLLHCEPLKEWPNLFHCFANTVTTPESVLDFVQQFGPLTILDEGDLVDDVIRHAKSIRDTWSLAQSWRWPGDKFFGPGLTLHAQIVWDPVLKGPSWEFWPNSLIDGLWLQLAQAVTRGNRMQTCMHCGTPFLSGLGTDRRLDAKFCLDEHRIAFNSLKRSREM
jgi:hypothetical protein